MGNSVSTTNNLNLIPVPHKSVANRLLYTAENDDMYITECYDNRANYIARRELTYKPNIITPTDEQHANTFFNEVRSQLPLRLLSDLKDVFIVQLMPSADGGMPHTRPGNVICCPSVRSLFNVSTLIHELWHIHQRNYQSLWLKIFNQLGWNLWTGMIPDKLEGFRRYNPDTIDAPLWIYNNTWVPLPIFTDIINPVVSDADIWFYNPADEYHVKDIPTEILVRFPDLPKVAYEHPRELAAYLLSEPDRYASNTGFTELVGLLGSTSVMTSKNTK